MTSLINRFKNFRHVPIKRPTTKRVESSSSVPTAGKLPGITTSPSQPILPPGEDSVSFERHTKVQAEFKKCTSNDNVVDDLMQRSFALRRKDILENGYDLDTLCEVPFSAGV